jgi:hypothetical protein
MSADALHVLRCKSNSAWRTHVHDVVVHEVGRIVADAGLGTGVHVDRKACSEYFPSAPPGNDKQRIPDVVFTEAGGTVRECLDVTIRRPECPKQRIPGIAARRAQRDKERLYAPWMQQRQSGKFTPLAAEAYGCLAPAFVGFLRRAGSHHARQLAGLDAEDPPEDCMTHLFIQRVSIQLQRAQSQSFRAILAEHAQPDTSLLEDQEVLSHLWEEAALQGAPTLEDTALVELE